MGDLDEVNRSSALAVGLLLLITVPFVRRAHNIDDPLYVEAALHVRTSPLDPLGGPSFWHERPTTFFFDLYNPPLTAYLLAPVVSETAGSEVRVHLVMIVLAALALLATASAGERLGLPPHLVLLLAASPALANSAVSALADVPFLLLTVLAWRSALLGRAGASGALTGTSALAKYVGLLNVPLCLVALHRRGQRAAVAAAVVGLLVFGGWCLWNQALYGQLHVRAASRFQWLSPGRQWTFLLSFVSSLGLAGLPAALGLLRWTPLRVTTAAVAGLAGAALVQAQTGSGGNALLGALAFGSGAALLSAAAAASIRAPMRGGFAAWCFWLYAAYTVLLVYFGAARYVLPLLPPLVWLLAGSGQLRADASRRRFGLSVAVAALLSLWVMAGDAGYAEAWRRAAERLPEGGRQFAVGHWGFQFYAAGRGYRPLDPREDLRPGDVIAEAQGIHGSPPSPAQRALLSPRPSVSVPSPFLRVMDPQAGAGLYSSAWGLLPFGLRAGAREVVALSTPASWLFSLLAAPVEGPVAVDLGSAEAGHVRLDGWSDSEAFAERGGWRTFVWAVGRESALRLPLPRGVKRLRLSASPVGEAVGPMRVRVGSRAEALVDLMPGWRTYEAALEGEVEGGSTTVVLQPAGRFEPGAFDHERREVSVAVDWVAFGEGRDVPLSRGLWPVARGDDTPGLFVSGARIVLPSSHGGRLEARLRNLAGGAEITWVAAGKAAELQPRLLWSALAQCGAPKGCLFEVHAPPEAGRLLLRADKAVLSDLNVEPVAP